MTTMIIVLTAAIGLFGVCVAVWSFIDTRKKYYNEYLSRKKLND